MQCTVFLEKMRQQVSAAHGSDTDTKLSPVIHGNVMELCLHGTVKPVEPACVIVKDLPGIGQLEVGSSQEQCAAQFFFQRVHMSAEGLLGDVQLLCRPADALFIYHFKEILHGKDVHNTFSPLLFHSCTVFFLYNI